MVQVFPQVIELNPVQRDCSIIIRNTSSHPIVFKIKSNNIEHLKPSKSFGQIPSKQQITIQIKIFGQNTQSKKLLVESIKLRENESIDYKDFETAQKSKQQTFIKINSNSSFLSEITFKKISFKQTVKFLLILFMIVGILFIIHQIDSIPEEC